MSCNFTPTKKFKIYWFSDDKWFQWTVLYLIILLIMATSGCKHRMDTIADFPNVGFIDLKDVRINYSIEGTGKTIIVIPGGPGLGFGYLKDEMTNILSNDFQLFFYDQRGCSHSTGTDDTTKLTMMNFVDDLEKLRKTLKLEKLNLLGHSFGGLLAMFYSIEHPENVESLILVESDPASKKNWDSFRIVISSRKTTTDKQELLAISEIKNWQNDPELVEKYYKIHFRSYFGNQNVKNKLHLNIDNQVLKNNTVTNSKIRNDLGNYDIHNLLNKIKCPTLTIYGDKSIFSNESITELTNGISNSTLIRIPESGHFPYMESPPEFLKAIKIFLK